MKKLEHGKLERRAVILRTISKGSFSAAAASLDKFLNNEGIGVIPPTPQKRTTGKERTLKYEKKVKSDVANDKKGNERDTLTLFCDDFFSHMFGMPALAGKKVYEFKEGIKRHAKRDSGVRWFGTLIGWLPDDVHKDLIKDLNRVQSINSKTKWIKMEKEKNENKIIEEVF